MEGLKPIGDYIRAKRKERGLSQLELAALVGVSRGYIAQLESNEQRNPSNKIIQALAKALKVPVYELLREAGMVQNIVKARSLTSVLNQLKQALPIEVPVYDFVTNEIIGSAYASKDGFSDGLLAYTCTSATADPSINKGEYTANWPGCKDNDIVFINTSSVPNPADIVLLRKDNRMHFARWGSLRNTPILGVVQSLTTKLQVT